MENVIIIGSGAAGYTAAIYAARAKLNPLIISGPEEGGQLTLTTSVENFPGFADGVMGPDLMLTMKKQAQKFGARFKTGLVLDMKSIKGGYELLVETEKIQTKTVIIATGASAKWLETKGEETYKGRGVTTCATCDGFLYRGKDVIVVGGGDSACEEATFLTKFAKKVTIVVRKDTFRASKIMQDRVKENPKISIKWNSEIAEVQGDGTKVTNALLKDTKTGKTEKFPVDGIFLAIGHIPNTKFLSGKVNLDDKGYVVTDRWMHTNLPGVFACGDVQDTKYRQAITAAGTGCQAAMEAEKYLSH